MATQYGDTYGGYIGLGGSIAPAPTESAIPAPPSVVGEGDAGASGPIPILPPPGGGDTPAPPPIVPPMVNPGTLPGTPSGCSTCGSSSTPTASSPPAAPRPTLNLAADASAIGATEAVALPTTAAVPSVPWWLWLVLAFGLGYSSRRGRR